MPDLRRTIRGVELVKTGTWQISTGTWTVTPADLKSAVDAHQAGVLRKPVIKLGHDSPLGDAAPALGYVDNLRLSADGNTLLGDLTDVPALLGDVLQHHYPDRSVEGLTDYTAPDGTTWPLVLTALALLGATAPGIDTLQSLQGLTDLYGAPIAATRITIPAPRNDRSRAVAVAAARRRRTHRLIER